MTEVLDQALMTLGTASARVGFSGDGIDRFLTIEGRPAFQLAYRCGSCGLVLRRQPGAAERAPSPERIRDRLNAGLREIDPEVIGAFSAVLPEGRYLVLLLDVRPTLVRAGSAEDYFQAEGVSFWDGGEESPSVSVQPANVDYYRLGTNPAGRGDELFEFAVPMSDPAGLDQGTVAAYRAWGEQHTPTAVSLSLLDIEGPWFSRQRHWGLLHYLLDGHHKMAAGGRVRLLSFVSISESLCTEEELARLPEILGSPPENHLPGRY